MRKTCRRGFSLTVSFSLLLNFAGAALYAQVGAPVLGFVPDGNRVRPVFGIPAAASISDPLSIPRGIARMAASPQQDYVLASTADTGEVVLMAPDGTLTSLKGAGTAPDELVISPEGSSAALWFSSISHAQVIAGLPRSPQVRDIDATFLGPSPYALAISDDGQWLAGAWRAGNYAFGPHGEVNRLPVEEIVPAAGFMHGSHDLVIATHEQILKVGDVGGANVAGVLLTGQGRLDAMAVAVAGGNQSVVVADPRGRITQLDLAGGAAQTADCGCSPQGLFPMGRLVFRLNGLDSGAFQLFDTSSGLVLAAPLLQSDPAGSNAGVQQ
jgi:hypothetical protein